MVLKRHKKQSNDQWRLLLLIDVFLLTSSSFDVATGNENRAIFVQFWRPLLSFYISSSLFEKLRESITNKLFYPPVSKASKGGGKFSRKKKSTYPRIWCQRTCLSVCLWSTLTQIISGLAEQNGLKNCNFGCQSCFCKPVFFLRQLIYDFLAENNYPDSPHLQGGMKLATHISPLLN